MFVICMWSSSLSLCFDNQFTTPLLYTAMPVTNWWNKLLPSENSHADDRITILVSIRQLCRRQVAWICLVFFRVSWYYWNLVISFFRIFEKMKHQAGAGPIDGLALFDYLCVDWYLFTPLYFLCSLCFIFCIIHVSSSWQCACVLFRLCLNPS
jgi:hypothetical protein